MGKEKMSIVEKNKRTCFFIALIKHANNIHPHRVIMVPQEEIMTRSASIKWIHGILCIFLLTGLNASGQAIKPDVSGFIAVQPDAMALEDGGFSQVVIAGDPGKPGIYVVRIKFSPGRMSRPHFHDQDRYITVIKGTWWVSLGPGSEVFDPKKTVPMKEGSFVKHPAGGPHYDGAKDEGVIVQIMGMGPVKTTRIEP